MEIKSKEGVIAVTKTHAGKVESSKEDKIKIRPFITDTASVGVKLSRKLPYGEVGLDVFIFMPCYKEEIREVFKEVKDLASELMIEGFTEILEGRDNK